MLISDCSSDVCSSDLSTSNTAPVAGVTLGAAISAFARSSGSMPWVMPLPLPLRAASSRGFASRRLCAKQRRNKESDCHAQARPRYDSADQCDRLSGAVRPGGRGPLVSPPRAADRPFGLRRPPCRSQARGSEERRVGKECGGTGRLGWSPYHIKKKHTKRQRQ